MLRRTAIVLLVVGVVATACGGGSTGPEAEVAAESSSGDEAATTTIRPEQTATTTALSEQPATTTTASTGTAEQESSASTSSTSTPTSSPPLIQSTIEAVYTPVPAGPGSVLVFDPFVVSVLDIQAESSEARIVFGPVDGFTIAHARMASDGSLVVELLEEVPVGEPVETHKVVQFGPDGSIVDLIDEAVLYDVAVFGGVESALVGEVWDGDVATEAQLVAVPLDGRPPIAFGTAFAPEYAVGSIDVAGELAVVSAFADLTEVVSYVDANGVQLVLPSPTDDLPYGREPFVLQATFSPDGLEVAWVEGPEHYADTDTGEMSWHGEWRIRSLDLVTGEERISWPFGFPIDDPFAQLVTGLTHTGDRLVVSRAVTRDALISDIEPLVLDLTTEEPELYELPVAGVIDVAG